MRLINLLKKDIWVVGSLLLIVLVVSGNTYLKNVYADPVIEDSVYLLPTKVESVGWNNVSTVGVQEISSDGTLGAFNKSNSAFVIFKNGEYAKEEAVIPVRETGVPKAEKIDVGETKETEGQEKLDNEESIQDFIATTTATTTTDKSVSTSTPVAESLEPENEELEGEGEEEQSTTTDSVENHNVSEEVSEEVDSEETSTSSEEVNLDTQQEINEEENNSAVEEESTDSVENENNASSSAPVTRFLNAIKRAVFSLVPSFVFADEVSTTTETSTPKVSSTTVPVEEVSSTTSVTTTPQIVTSEEEKQATEKEIEEKQVAVPSKPSEDEVIDTEAPTLTVLGNNPAVLAIGSTYNDLGVTVSDNINNNLGFKTSVDGVEVSVVSLDTKSEGVYEITYSVVDQAGNTGTAKRMVYVGIEPEEKIVSEAENETILDTFTCDNSEACTTNVLEVSGFGVGGEVFGEGLIDTAQLRISMGSNIAHSKTNELPLKLEIEYFYNESWFSAGSIVLDEEVSNAINGGYFLYALPFFESWAEFADFKVRIRYDHNKELEGGVYIDSIWIEAFSGEGINKEEFGLTKEEKKRAEIEKGMKKPKLHSVIKGKPAFEIDENPEFEFEYELQRSNISRFFRGLFKDDPDYRVSSVEIKTASGQDIDLPISLRYGGGERWGFSVEKNNESLHPGKYEVSITIHEGSKSFTDSFEFYWGVLTVNTNKSIYSPQETALFSMAALTDNGHTMCDAILRLVVVDPDQSETVVPVEKSGLCDGNNVIDVPDYFGEMQLAGVGEYQVSLERYNEEGGLVIQTNDIFEVRDYVPFDVEREGPTRIYPPAPYVMSISFRANEAFDGVITETVPKGFIIEESEGANVVVKEDVVEISWPVSVRAGERILKTYRFDAPDISPYIYETGPLVFKKEIATTSFQEMSTSSPLCSEGFCEEEITEEVVFQEIRTWKIASDAVGRMLILWDGGAAPAGWECVSCTGGDPFYQRFIRGGATYGGTGGSATHTHTASVSVGGPSATTGQTPGGSTVSGSGHTHTFTPTVSSASNLPEYRQLRVLRSTSAGTPATLPAGAIVFFTDTVPTEWTRYSAQDGRFVRGESGVGTTGGANTHSHTITGTTGAASGDTYGTQNGQTRADVAQVNHTHSVSGSTDSVSNTPPYIETILGKIDADGSLPIGMLAMWDEDVPVGWNHKSESGDPFFERFILPSATYGTIGGNITHSHANQNIVSGGPAQTTTARAGGNVSSSDHTHTISLTSYSSPSHLPPYINVVIAEFLGTDPVFTQAQFRWYTNANVETPTDAWPQGSTLNLNENEPITATSTPVSPDDVVRLRMAVGVGNATSTAGSVNFKLQYGQGSVCSAVTTWSDVGEISSSTPWIGYDNTSVLDGVELSSTTLSLSNVFGSYEEENNSTTTPNDISVGEYVEYDWVIQHNNATSGVPYCFRMVEGDGTQFFTYTSYPKLQTNSAPNTPTLDRLFDNEKIASTSPHFWFDAEDDEGDALYYQIQVDEDFAFGSVLIDNNSQSHGDQFTNLINPSQKEPYTEGNTVQFIPSSSLSNNTTYWWRVRAWDPNGSEDYGEWSEPQSFTTDSNIVESTWFQTTDEQFDTNTLNGVRTLGTDAVELNVGSSTGSMYSTFIDFSDGTYGNIWEEFSFNDAETTGSISYQVEYQTDEGAELVPDSILPGNSTGFGTSPVNLSGVDPEVYDNLRLVANFTNSGGSPQLLDWTLKWGTKIDTPTLLLPFANERFPTTTPTFTFTTTDQQSDDLQYEVSWSTVYDFTSSTTRNSSLHAGFANTEDSGDSDPFTSGDTIRFTIQPADALTASTTYWWRVRAKDPSGGNAFSDWSEPRSFTHNYLDVVSTWFQTTDEQFNTNILSGTRSTGSDSLTVATTSNEAMIVYGEGAVTTPQFRIWNGSSWSSESSALSVDSQINWVAVKEAPTREEYVLGTLGLDSDVNVQVYSEGIWDNLLEVTASISNADKRGFDITYESISGDAMVVSCDGDSNPTYYTWNGSSWSSPGTITTSTGSSCEWIRLASNPVSDEIIMVTLPGGGGQYEAQVWNGSAWGNAVVWGGMSEAHEGIGVAYQPNGALAVVTVNNDGSTPPNRMSSRTWNGSFWSGTTDTNVGYFEQGTLVADDGTNNMNLCFVNDATTVQGLPWTGTAWGTQTQLDATAHAKNDRPVDCVYETTSGRDGNVLTAYSDTTSARYSVLSGGTWSAEASISTISRSATVQLERVGDGLILGTFFDHVNERYDFSYWNGSAWSTAQTLENTPSVSSAPFKEPFMMAARGPATSGTVAVSPGIVFSDGTGPYWGELSFSNTTPGASGVLYQVQYATATTYELIPDVDLTGNSTGFTTSPVDLTGLDITTYDTIRVRATLTCDGSDCPTLDDWTVTWAEGATVSGTIAEHDETTAVTEGTVAVAVNGVLQTGKTGEIQGDGTWSITNVTAFVDDIITVFVSGATSENKAVAVTKYDGVGDITGIELHERHLTFGSDDTSPVITNSDLGLFDIAVGGSDVFFDVDASNNLVATSTGGGFDDVVVYVTSGTTYRPDSTSSGNVSTHDIAILGTIMADGNTISLSGSWRNSSTFSEGTSHVVFTALSGSESIDSTGASASNFYRVTFGQTSGTATWLLSTPLVVTNNTAVNYGTLSPGSQTLSLGGNLAIGSSGLFTKGTATTTFNGTGSSVWSDASSLKQDMGIVVIDGTSKTVTLGSNVQATDIVIGANDTFDITTGNYSIGVNGSWTNNNTFLSRQGEVNFTGSSFGVSILPGSSSFYNLSFGGSGSWTFGSTNITVVNDFSISNGFVTLPSGTTTISGSFLATASGSFAGNTGTVLFTGSSGSESISQNNSSFYNLVLNGSGSWSFSEQNATTTNNVQILSGTLTAPSGALAIGGSFTNAGTFTHNSGALRFYSSGDSKVVQPGLSSINDIIFDGSGGWVLSPSANITVSGDVSIISGTATSTAETLSVGGSWLVGPSGIFNHYDGTIAFNSSDTGETIASGNSPFGTVSFNNSNGGWAVTENATSSSGWNITDVSEFTVESGVVVAVGGDFSNDVGGAETTWTGSTLVLNSNTPFSINDKSTGSDEYASIVLNSGTKVSMWNSSATAVSANSDSYLYSQDHAGVDGNLYIWGEYVRSSGVEHWSHATDFDGTSLSGSERAVSVLFDSGASAEINNSTLSIVGGVGATTTINNQGSGAYSLSVVNSTTTAQYYAFRNLDSSGFVLTGETSVTSLSNGDFELSADGGSLVTLSAETIDENPTLQISRVRFATSTGITSGFNVTATGTPTSYWWYRNHYGNYAGEAFDNDPGDNPGNIRWDDSNLSITVSGIVYYSDRATTMGSPVCDGSTNTVRVDVQGGTGGSAPCNATTGEFSIEGVSLSGDGIVTTYLDTNGGSRAVAISKTPTADITNLGLYESWLTIRNEDVNSVSISDLVAFDSSGDSDVFFSANEGSPDTLVLEDGFGLYVEEGKSFSPNGNITLVSGSTDFVAGTFELGTSSLLTFNDGEDHAVGGSFIVGTNATATVASSSLTFTATTSGKTITPNGSSLYDVAFTGVGGEWELSTSSITGDFVVTAGTVVGTSDVLVTSGSITGNGVLAFTDGAVTLQKAGNFGGSENWTFANLVFGDGTTNATTTKIGANNILVENQLTIDTNHVLLAGDDEWELGGSGTPFVISGDFDAETSTVTYSGTSATTVTAEEYNALTLAPSGAGSPNYTLASGSFILNTLVVGDGVNTVSVNANTTDPLVNVNGDVTINSNATYVSSNSSLLSVGGSWTNNGAFTHSNGTVLFNSSDTGEIVSSGNSAFGNLLFSNVSGGWAISGNATTSGNLILASSTSFTLSPGSTLSVGGMFENQLDGGVTTWDGTTLVLEGAVGYSVNSATSTGDTYNTLVIDENTDVRLWSSSAGTTTVASTASLYSQDHAGVDGDLYIWGDYRRTTGNDYWSYATDFDGTALTGGSERQVNVRFAPNASTTVTGGSLQIIGTSDATTTIDRQSTGNYGIEIEGGTFTASYYSFENMGSRGLGFSGTPTVTNISDGDFELGLEGQTLITVDASVIDANPTKTFSRNRFATAGSVTSGINVTVEGTSVSSWRFSDHYGDLDGEANDSDPGGDPGYVIWDDSAGDITVSGVVYQNDRVTPAGGAVCDGTTNVVRLLVEGAGSYFVPCASGTGVYTIPSVTFLPSDVFTVFLDNASEDAVAVTYGALTSIANMHLYTDHVIVRHEGVDPITISELAVYDGGDDADIPYTTTLTPDTLSTGAGTALYVWQGKTFTPGGDVTVTGNGTTNEYDGTLYVWQNANFVAEGSEYFTIGGSLIASSSAVITSASSDFDFTSTATGKVVRTNSSPLASVTFSGSGGAWSFPETTVSVEDDFTITAGSVSLPVGTTTVAGSFINNGGTFTHNSGTVQLNGTEVGNSIQVGGSDFYNLTIGGTGSWTFLDTNATTTNQLRFEYGSTTLPSGVLTVGATLTSVNGTFNHNNGDVKFISTSSGNVITQKGSGFGGITFDGTGGSWSFAQSVATTTKDFAIVNGSVALPTDTLRVGGSFINEGSFSHSTGTVLMNSALTGEVITPGSDPFHNLTIQNSAGGWTLTGSATTTNNFNLSTSTSFTLVPGSTLNVGGSFTNTSGGAGTSWDGTTINLTGGNSYSINGRLSSGDEYNTLVVSTTTKARLWSSSAGTTTVASTASLYSQDHAGVDGDLYIWGDYRRTTGNDYWSYATDFDGTALTGGSERQVNVRFAPNASTTVTGGSLQIIGASDATTTIDRQSTGTYGLSVLGGTVNVDRYQIRNIDELGLYISGQPTVTSLSNGDYELDKEGGSMITVSSTTIDFNPSLFIGGAKFATSTGITSGFNVTLLGTPINAWTFTGHSGNYDGEAYDSDGGDACGKIRWSDSVCLFVSQESYRFRNDDGGEGVPNDEWYHSDWDKRMRIAITNASTSALTNQQVKIELPKATDMQSDYGDLRFTDNSGTTTIDYWIESYTTATSTVWVKVPNLPAEETTGIYVYYDTVATLDTDGVATSTLIVYDGFEDNNISEYSGDTSMFSVSTGFDFEGTYGLTSSSGNEDQRTTDGIYRTGTGSTVSQGETIHFAQYIDTSLGFQDEPCMVFGVQTPGSNNENYAVCLDVFGDSVVISKDVSSNDGSGTILASDTSVGFSSGWYEVEIDWLTSGVINVAVYDDSGALFSEVSTTDSSYSSGGYGFGFWIQYGGWDYVSSWKYTEVVPTYTIGIEQVGEGATWSSAENSPLAGQSVGEDMRLRFLVQNSGPEITDQNFRLQVASKEGYGSCSSVPYGSFSDVPVSGSCGSSVACMSTSSQVVNSALTTQLLSVPDSVTFTQGRFVESPSNQTSNIDIGTNLYTEVEYIFDLTNYAVDSAYCLRTTDSGTPLDNYANIAEVSLIHAPTITNFNLNDNQNIELSVGASTTIYATGTVIDLNGYEDLVYATSSIYRTGVGATCTPDDNSCYQVASTSCSFVNCSGNSCDVICSADIAFFADPTDGGVFEAEEWEAEITVVDQGEIRDTGITMGVEMGTLRALTVENEIDYGTLEVASNTGDANATSTVINKGNDTIDVNLYGTDLVGGASTISVNNQKFATSTFSYSACTICPFLDSSPVPAGIDLSKPTTTVPVMTEIYWGLNVPIGTAGVPHFGQTTFEATGSE
ncbi:MAG: DUF2341 domain-containing protein [Candidatus Paceibacterota bacterium]